MFKIVKTLWQATDVKTYRIISVEKHQVMSVVQVLHILNIINKGENKKTENLAQKRSVEYPEWNNTVAASN